MIKLYFKEGTTFNLNSRCEDEVLKQMRRNPNKRLYLFGVDFEKVIKAEVIKDDDLFTIEK